MAHEKNCRPFPIEPAPYAPGGECHPRPPRPTPPPPPGCGPSQYVGARYVPKFADPIEWDIERGYESLTIVTYKGESYTSKCPVPPGIDIKNTRYWALTGAYNAQVEEYKNQVKDLSQQVTEFASDNKEFREKITQYDKDNAEMKNTVASTVARVDALAERVDNADAAISDLQAGQAQTVKDIAALEAKDADLQRQITSNDTDISALQAKDREQDARLDAIETVNDAQAATIAQNTQDIARNTANIQDNAANIAVNSKELAKHAAQLKDHDAQLTVLHKEVTDNHTAIERLTSVTDGLRADLTEDEAKIAQNADAIAHIQQKDVQQDGRLDALENRATAAEGRLDALDTKTDATNAALTAETNRAKAAELANGELIAANAQELAKHADELSDHKSRITALETKTDGHTQDISDLKAKDAALETAIAAVDDKVEHLELIDPKEYAKTIARLDAKDTAQDGKIQALETASADHVTKQEFAADQKRQDDIVGDWTTAHPGQTIAECVTSQESELAEHADELSDHKSRITALETKTDGHTQDISDLKAKDAALETAIAAVDDKVEHLELIDPKEYAKTIARLDAKDTAQDGKIQALETASADHVTKQEFAADQKRQDDIVGDWTTAHPGQTIAECVTSQESELAEHAGSISRLETDKANKSDIPSLDGYATKVYVDNGLSAKVDTSTYTTEQAAQDELINKKVDQWADPYQRTKCVAMFAAVNKQEDGTMELFGVFPAGNGLRKNPNTSPFSLAYGEGGTVRIFKPDGTEVDKSNLKASYNNWGQAYNMMPTLRVTLKPTFTPDSPFYILLYQNDASKPDSL